MRKKLSEIQPGERFWTTDCRSVERIFVGPCEGGWVVQDCKTWNLFYYLDDTEYEIIVPTPEPKYRPFANAEEFEPHRDRWIDRWISASHAMLRVTMYTDLGLWYDGADRRVDWVDALEEFTFDDGSPFGVVEK